MKKIILVLVVLFVSFQLNAQWVQTNGPYGGSINCFASSGPNIFAGSDSGVFLSTNNGTKWSPVNTGMPKPAVNNYGVPIYKYITALTFSGTNVFAGTSDGGVFLSTNNGTNWTAVYPAGYSGISSMAVIGSNLFVGRAGEGVMLTTDNGTDWTALIDGIPYRTELSMDIKVLTVSGSTIFAGTAAGVYLSTNNGTNWWPVNNGLTNTGITTLTVNGSNIFAGTVSLGFFPFSKVYLSTNNGTSWTQINGLTYVSAFAVSGNNVFAGNSSGVFLSTNNGMNWLKVNEALTDTIVNTLIISGGNLFAGTQGAGVWRRPLSELTGVSNDVKIIPKEFIVYQNYPNPFNPSTVIKYAVPFESNVNIRFYNSLGQIVREVNEGNREPGNHEINFNSSGLSSGIYFYSIRAVSADGKNDFSAVKKMILLK